MHEECGRDGAPDKEQSRVGDLVVLPDIAGDDHQCARSKKLVSRRGELVTRDVDHKQDLEQQHRYVDEPVQVAVAVGKG